MARKKTSHKKPSPEKEFSSSPFKDLKGLSAFKKQAALPESDASQKNDAAQKSVVADETARPSNEGTSFAEEMDFLGVKPLPGKTIQESALNGHKRKQPPTLTKVLKTEPDKEVFLKALGSMDTIFFDEWSEEESLKRAVPRRMKQVERGQLKPEAALDLHGLTVEEAYAKVGFFLQDALYQGLRILLIITGKGLHSSDEPVLRNAVEKLLQAQGNLVLEWGLAPQRYGGSGALVVFLRPAEKSS